MSVLRSDGISSHLDADNLNFNRMFYNGPLSARVLTAEKYISRTEQFQASTFAATDSFNQKLVLHVARRLGHFLLFVGTKFIW